MTNERYYELYQHLSACYDEIGGYEFYKNLFPNNENKGEHHTDFSKPNAIYLYKDERDQDTKRRLRRRVMLNDTWEEDYINYVECNPLTLCSGLSYRRKSNKIENAQKMHALIFDLDGVGKNELQNLFLRFGQSPYILRSLPVPTYLVISGTGLHVYYVFEEPIDLYPNIKIQLKSLKYDLTFRLWEYKATSTEKQIQYQSINQGFRMVGSINDKYNVEIKAFCTGEKVTLDYLNQYARHKENQVDINKPFKPSKITRAEAREAYPEWYQRVVVNKKRQMKKWDISGKQGYALYEWWIRQAYDIKGGHRYYFLMCMAIYACKCDVPKKKLVEDMHEVFQILSNIEHDNPLTEEDIQSALEAYDKEYYNFTIFDIEKLTDIRIERNKRNGRKQGLHLKMARSNLAIMNEDIGSSLQGRPEGSGTKKELVEEWRKANPEGTKADCIRETKLSKPTVYKWW